jgi:hypothetical protein
MTASPPGLILSGGATSDANSEDDPNALAQIYQNLLSGAADIVSGLNDKMLVVSAGAIELAGAVQVQAHSETPQEVANNLAILGSIAAFCDANGIKVLVDADLTYAATYGDGSNALVDQWATAAAAVGLPITAVEDVQEIGSSQAQTTFANFASIEVNAVQTLIENYATSSYRMTASNLTVGDMEGGGPSSMTAISAWWSAYNVAAQAAGVQTFSFATADTSWNVPWIFAESTPAWHGYLESLSTLAASDHIALAVDLQGPLTASSSAANVAQAEQDAAALAILQGTGAVNIANLKFETWGPLPDGTNLLSSPTSAANEAAEIDATYPLYEAGSITAEGFITASAPAQAIVTSGSNTSIGSLSVQWDTADVQAGYRLGVVIIDQTGALTATQHGAGTVADPAANILVLSGNSADLAAELSSIRLTEPYSGPDTIDIEIFGTVGQLSDNRISVLALQAGQNPNQINATSNLQGWVSSSAFLNGGNVMTSETLNWNTTGTLAGTISGATPGQSAFVKLDAVHEPLAEYGVEHVTTFDGVAINAIADVNDPSVDNATGIANAGGAANNPGQGIINGLASWLAGAFDPAAPATLLTVTSTTNTFDPSNGMLETSEDILAADSLTVVNLSGTMVPNTYATQFNMGGTQVVEYNTGNNPGWQVGWGSQFDTATLTYDSAGKLVEEFLQGGASDPSFTIDDVFDPNTGNLWEQFQSAAPPPPSSYSFAVNSFVTGPLYVTEFNTGDNPNWDYLDWGTSAASDTEVWTDYLIIQNATGFFVSENSAFSYNYEFTNGTTLDLLNIPGAIDVNLNSLGIVVIDSQTLASGLGSLTAIDAAGATGAVTLTGLAAGGSTLIGGNTVSTINGYGHDTIVAGNGTSTINTGSGGSTVLLSGTAGTATINGNNNVVTDSAAATSLTVNGDSVATTGAAGDTITATGVGDVVSLSDGGTIYQGGSTLSATVDGNSVTVWMNSAGGTVTAVGNNNVVIGEANASINLIGNGDMTGTQPGGIIGITGQNDVVHGSVTINEAAGSSNLLVYGSIDTVNAASGDSVTVYGMGEVVNGSNVAVTIGKPATSVTVNGNGATVSIYAGGGTATAQGNNDIVTGGANAVVTLNGADDAASLGNFSTVVATGNASTINIQSNGCISLSGSLDIATVSSNTTAAWEDGNGETITAGNSITAWMVGNSDTLIAGNAATIDLAGSFAVANLGSAAVTWEYGFGTRDTVQVNGGIGQYGTDEIGVGGSYTSGWELGVGGQITAGDHSSVMQETDSNTASLGNHSSITASGTFDAGTLLANGTISISGRSDSIVAGISATATITGNSDTLTVGSNSSISVGNGVTGEVINDASSTVTLGNNISATISGSASVINNGTASAVTLTPQNTITIAAGASLAAAITNTGTIDLTSGTLVFQQALSNSATFLLGGTATLDFVSTVASGGAMRFIQAGGTLEAQAGGSFGAQISGFAMGDRIDAAAVLYGLAPTATYSGGTLTVTDGTHTDSFALAGTYTPTGFQLASDGHSGTAISYT